MVVTLENKMFFNPFRLGQAENEKVQTDSPKKKAVGEKIVIDAEDLLSIARNDLEDSGWLSPEIEINSLDKIPLGEYLQAGISKMKSTDWA